MGVSTLQVAGHPAVEVYLEPDRPPALITVCANCGQLRTILFLTGDRWFCFRCKTEGAAPPNLYPIS